MGLRFLSFFGLLVFLLIGWLLSRNRKAFPWQTVLWGVALQAIFALIILRTPIGTGVYNFADRGVTRLNLAAGEGLKLVVGPLAEGEVLKKSFGPQYGYIFALAIMGTIIVVSAVSSLLYHWGILPKVVQSLAFVMQKVMRTSGSETLSSAANIFIGQTEAPLLVKPYLSKMTQSELLAVMVGGMATIAGGVMAVYVLLGASAGTLMTASVMSAPAALVFAKILVPETERSETAAGSKLVFEKNAVNGIDAVCRGASDGMMLSINVVAMLIAFVAVVALANFLLSWGQRLVGIHDPVTLQKFLGWVNAPFAWLMGMPWKDCGFVGQILGERIVLNEFFGYLKLTQNQANIDPRTFTLASYALCGFANFGSIAIQIGGIGALAPERRGDLAKLGLLAMVGGLLACYMTACIAGILM